MRNSEIIAKAEQVLDLAKRCGFRQVALQLIDDDDNVFSSVEDYAFEYGEEGESNLRVYLLLSNLTLDISRDPNDEDADPIITYP